MALQDIVTKGATDRSVTVRIIDSGDGTPETGVVFNTAGIDLWYRREGAAKTTITEATLSALTDAHSDGGFLHIADGEYRLDLPDAAFATGANHVDYGGTVTGMVVVGGRVRLIGINLEDAVRAGMTALPNAAADAAGGLPISDAGGLDLDAQRSDVAAILTDTGTTLDGKLDTIDGNVDAVLEDTGTTLPSTLATIAGYLDTEIAAIKAKTDQLTFTLANKLDASIQAAGDFAQGAADKVWSTAARTLTAFGFSVTVGTNNDKTGYSLSAAAIQAIWDALTSALTTVGSIGKLLVDNINATVSSRAPEAGGNVAAIKAKTDNLPASPAATGDAMTLTAGERNAIADAHLDRADSIEAGLTVRQAHRLEAAAAAGKLSGAATATVTVRNAVADSKNRITATVDADGNRSAVATDVT